MKKVIWVGLAVFGVFVVGGLAGVLADRVFLPWLSAKDAFRKHPFFQKVNENVTVINRTEQVTVKEDFSVSKTAQNVLPTIVSIIAYDQPVDQADVKVKIQSSLDIQQRIRTGIIVTSDGLIVTVGEEISGVEVKKNENVKYKVLASDGREFDATLKSSDPYTGLDFFQAQASNLPAVMLGNSDEVESGEKIIIAGNATGEYQNTFASGIIKEKDKTFTLLNSELSSSERLEGALMTDAQIDRRNVGGPVIDFNGGVIGLANQIEKDGKKAGYILPANNLKEAVDRVIRDGEIRRPTLGIYYLSINREIALLDSLPVSQGALVHSFTGQQGLAVIKNSAADLAGIKLGDIITEVAGEKIDLDHSLSELVAKQPIDQEVTIKVLRQGKSLDLKTKLTGN